MQDFEVQSKDLPRNGKSNNGFSDLSLYKVNQTSAPPPGVGVEGVASPRHTELDEYGYVFGRSARVTEPDDAHIRVLTNKAKSAAEETQLGEFRPDDIPADRETDEKLVKLKQDENEIKEQLRKTEGSLLNSRIQEAESPPPEAGRPEEPTWQIILSAIVLAIPFAPTFYDLWPMTDVVLHWLTAVSFSLFIGFGMAKLAFYLPPTKSANRLNVSYLNFVGGIGVAVGLGVFRLAISDNIWIAVAYTAIELFFILLIYLAAENYKHSVYRWDQENDLHQKPKQLVQVLEDRVAELKARLKSTKDEIEIIRAEFYHRHVQSLIPEKVVQSFIDAILAGYFRAIAVNKAEYETLVRR